MVFNTTFQQYFSYIVAVKFYWWRKLEYKEKTADIPQVTDKLLSHNVVSSTPHHVYEQYLNSQL